MDVELEYRGQELVAHLTGEIDHHTAAGVRAGIDGAAEARPPRLLRLDMGGVTFMDSSGVGLVMGRYRLITGMGGRLVVSGAGERVQELMRLAGLDKLDIWEKGESNNASQSK